MTRVFIGGGRKIKIRPGDIVGAITAVTSLQGKQIGPITILDRHSVVSVPADAADMVIEALSGAPIKGKKLSVRRDRT
jgi:ATP-dependent RNA helicase DeaD